jgi:hypothetical protein
LGAPITIVVWAGCTFASCAMFSEAVLAGAELSMCTGKVESWPGVDAVGVNPEADEVALRKQELRRLEAPAGEEEGARGVCVEERVGRQPGLPARVHGQERPATEPAVTAFPAPDVVGPDHRVRVPGRAR